MDPAKLQKFEIKIPFYSIATIAAGFYIGYNEGKGNPVSNNIEFMTKYAPTISSLVLSPFFIKLSHNSQKKMSKHLRQNLYAGNLEVTLEDSTIKSFSELDEDKKKELSLKLLKTLDDLESRLENTKYVNPTLRFTGRTAVESVMGYVAGRLFSYTI